MSRRPQDKLDGFVPAHFIGWYLKVRQSPCCWGSWVDIPSGLSADEQAVRRVRETAWERWVGPPEACTPCLSCS